MPRLFSCPRRRISGISDTNLLHVIERITRPDKNTLHYEATIDDPGAYTKPWTVAWDIPWAARQELRGYRMTIPMMFESAVRLVPCERAGRFDKIGPVVITEHTIRSEQMSATCPDVLESDPARIKRTLDRDCRHNITRTHEAP